jgi:excisionase family DNA binding protein
MPEPTPSRRAGALSGSRAIAKALGVCPNTIRKMVRDGRLPVFRSGVNTSPFRISRVTLAKYRREIV